MIEILVVSLAALLAIIARAMTGFGLSLLIPILLLHFSAPVSVITALIIGNILSLLTLFTEKRGRQISWPVVRRLLITAVPGTVVGAYIVAHTDKAILQIVVGVLVIASVLIQEYTFPKPTKPLGVSRGIDIVGFLNGALTVGVGTAMTLILWIRSHKVSAHQMRDNLSVIFFFINSAGIAAILYTAPHDFEARDVQLFILLLPVTLIGYIIGKILVDRINPHRYHKLIFYIVILIGLGSILAGVRS